MSENLTTISSLTGEQDNDTSATVNDITNSSQGNYNVFNDDKPSFKDRLRNFFTSKYFLFVALVVLLIGVGLFVYFQFFSTANNLVIKDPTNIGKKDTDDYTPKNNGLSQAEGTEYPNLINGVYLSKATYETIYKRKPVAVMLNNHVDSRPQAGLSQADIIYEIVAEGGISRIMPIFHSQIPDRVGSIRSARIYFMQIAAEYWPIFSHWGIAHRPDYELGLSAEEFDSLLAQGAAETDPRADARSYLDEIALPVANTDTTPNMFYREDDINAAIEHTGYAKFENVYDEFKKFYPEPSWSEFQKFDSWVFKDKKVDPVTPISTISYNFWDFPGFATTWNYISESNTYKRAQGDVVTVDRNNQEKLQVVTLIIQYAKETKLNDVKGHLLYDVIGEGDAVIYQDGGKTLAKWSKSSARERTSFTTTTGSPIDFNRGLIWVTVLPDYAQVTEN